MFEKVSTELNFVEREKEVEKLWRERNVFKRSIDQREGCDVFTFYDGPPTANGKPHIGHILTRVMKDMIPRYRTMKGYKVLRKAGWDTHGLPVELEVEKKSSAWTAKSQIEAYGSSRSSRSAKSRSGSTSTSGSDERASRILGGPGQSVRDLSRQLHRIGVVVVKTHTRKGLMYKGYKVVPYCPRCGTALSHEVAQGYKDVEEPAIFVQLQGDGGRMSTSWSGLRLRGRCRPTWRCGVNADDAYVSSGGKTAHTRQGAGKAVMGDAEMEYR